ncbi:hypothetical protein T440DRAFT_525652 [Plenodomus tracheiphilus IPT5]|uniref:Uncharacterized protein n=1 Tax=Plenodomus tracheiphilus IPT5 TaxID=1408161 RepID=A0A6A7AMU2_9PLEO|nr:hypothetical protein T440DRAFT_525652 [Plenodomus tracheiphilus IPT5]
MPKEFSPLPPSQPWPSLPQLLFIKGLPKGIPNESIRKRFSALYDAIIVYVENFYTVGQINSRGPSQIMIEQASTSLLLPWPQILELLGDTETRSGVLTMFIARSMLSRSLLLKLGTSNGPGATFLPPEVVDCFQSFCIDKSAIKLDGDGPKPVNFALLSRWKQISATLLHSTYVANEFSPFDGRTVNIERAMKDLGPLLAIYAIPHDAGLEDGARLSGLRGVLRKGARFAFTLFSQPCFWEFDWYTDRETKTREGDFELNEAQRIENSSLSKIVVWPRLTKIIDKDGRKLGAEGDVTGVQQEVCRYRYFDIKQVQKGFGDIAPIMKKIKPLIDGNDKTPPSTTHSLLDLTWEMVDGHHGEEIHMWRKIESSILLPQARTQLPNNIANRVYSRVLRLK